MRALANKPQHNITTAIDLIPVKLPIIIATILSVCSSCVTHFEHSQLISLQMTSFIICIVII